MMKAAVIHRPDAEPIVEMFAEPEPRGPEVLATVLAAGLHPLVRGHARGAHYSSGKQYPLIPGVDGVVAMPDGSRLYTGWLRAPYGTFAERAAVAQGVPLDPGADSTRVAGLVNPASSSWLALRLRARLSPGERVVVLGATGAGGRLAVQIARALGAGRVLAVGRDLERLRTVGADAAIALDASYRDALIAELRDGVDVILDYLWGEPALRTFEAILAARGSRRLRYVNIGQSAPGDVVLSPHVLRATDLELCGSGMGSIAQEELVREMPPLVARIARGEFTLPLRTVPLSEVPNVWRDGGRERTVILPSA